MRQQQQQTTQQQQQQQQRRPQTRPQAQQRAQQPSQPSQGQEKPVLEFFHANRGGKFKKLVLSVSQRGGVILRLSEKREDGVKSIVFSLSRTELISLSREIEFCLMGVANPTPKDGSGRASLVEFFHANKNGQFKKLSVEVFKDGGIALVLRQGEKGIPSDGIVFALSRGETIHLSEELKLLFYKRV